HTDSKGGKGGEGHATGRGAAGASVGVRVPPEQLLHALLSWVLLSASVGQATVQLDELTGDLVAVEEEALWQRVRAHLSACAAEGRRTPLAAAEVGVCAHSFARLADAKLCEAVRI
ncbi:hypothetical protein T492DRAFT_906713, partial [Pavlovales sp. CCMP2436]